jgi:hypothetical protein
MLDLLGKDVATFLAAVWIFTGLFLPVIAIWFLYRVARDLRRIAVAMERTNRAELDSARDHWVAAINEAAPPTPGIANSMFGR